jgi:hypothetical protein
MQDNQARDKIKQLRRHGETSVMWDMTSNCWNVEVKHYQEALAMMRDYHNFYRSIKLTSIPMFTWLLKENSMPFSKNRVITMEERGQTGKSGYKGPTFKDCGSAGKSDMKTEDRNSHGQFDRQINPKF